MSLHGWFVRCKELWTEGTVGVYCYDAAAGPACCEEIPPSLAKQKLHKPAVLPQAGSFLQRGAPAGQTRLPLLAKN